MNIRTAERSEVKAFQLYDADNAGDCFIVVEHDGELVGFAQYEDWSDEAKVFFMESNMRGAGRAKVIWLCGQENLRATERLPKARTKER